jgi:hypothetical protein
MINPKECRIGNWVAYPSNDFYPYGQVTARDFILPDFWENCSPISIAPEWLERAGFEKDGFNQYGIDLPKTLSLSERRIYFAGDYLYLQESDSRGRNVDLVTLWNRDIMRAFSLHKLQNLYLELAGQELAISPLPVPL